MPRKKRIFKADYKLAVLTFLNENVKLLKSCGDILLTATQRGHGMDRKDYVLAVLSTANKKVFTPVQVQKLFFLIDKAIPGLVEGPRFNFEPYNYGPFDKSVYWELNGLSAEGMVRIVRDYNWDDYLLTDEGQEKGEFLFNQIHAEAQPYIKKISDFVRSLSFSELVSAVYKAFPEMRENSVFQE